MVGDVVMEKVRTLLSLFGVLGSFVVLGCADKPTGDEADGSDDPTESTGADGEDGGDGSVVDDSSDGVPAEDACDDSDPNLGRRDDDADCYGVLSVDDCDEDDSTMPVESPTCRPWFLKPRPSTSQLGTGTRTPSTPRIECFNSRLPFTKPLGTGTQAA